MFLQKIAQVLAIELCFACCLRYIAVTAFEHVSEVAALETIDYLRFGRGEGEIGADYQSGRA